MRIVNEEVFGPVMLIIPFSNDDEAVKLANSTDYALGSSVFSGDSKRAYSVARRVVAGMATINDFGVGYLIQSLPFGGSKISGFGRFGGPEGLREFSRLKSVVTDRFPGVLTKVPPYMLISLCSNVSSDDCCFYRRLPLPNTLFRRTVRRSLAMLCTSFMDQRLYRASSLKWLTCARC